MSEQGAGTKDKGDQESIAPRVVNKFHAKSDVDTGASAQHHTIGMRKDQAASGSHNHDGKDSLKLLTGISITGSRASGAALTSVIAALVNLGVTDQTTA
jgi:hypothetical protein